MGIIKAKKEGIVMLSAIQFKELYNDASMPSIFDNMSDSPYKNKDMILKYLRNGTITSYSPAIVCDVISNEKIGGDLYCANDGKYFWRSDLIYYVEKYNLRLPKDFEEHILSFYKSI